MTISNDIRGLVHHCERQFKASGRFPYGHLEAGIARIVRHAVEAEKAAHPRRKAFDHANAARFRADIESRSVGCLRVPSMGRSPKAVPLRRSLTYTASNSGISELKAAIVATYFLEGIANEVAAGNIVSIPSFGAFGPWLWVPKTEGDSAVYPRFVPARGFRQQVRALCAEECAQNYRLEAYRRRHHPSSRPDMMGSSTTKAMRAMREQFLSQIPGVSESDV